jgi:hypothetical protein
LKLNFLEPKWYGTPEEMIQFGRECVASDKWTGMVPLVLPNVHEAVSRYIEDPARRRAYWRQPEVWQDVQAGYEKYFKLNPAETDRRKNYAMHAFQCGQLDDFLKQAALMGEVNYAVFGGKEVFDKMVEAAKKNGGKK